MASLQSIFEELPTIDADVALKTSNLSRGVGPSLKCPMVVQPSYEDNLEVLGILAPIIFSIGAVLVAFIFVCYLDIVRHILTYVPPRFKASSIMVVSIYPIVALVSYLAIIIPRFQLLTEAIIMFAWMTALYQLFSLFVLYSGGETRIVKQVEAGIMDLQVAPLCCFPCCCFPKLDLNKSRLRIPRLLILQLSLVQSIVYLSLLVMFSEDEHIYQSNYLYFQPFAIPSILSAVWGMTIALRMLAPTLAAHHMYGKYASLQFVLVCTKIQGSVARIAVAFMAKPCVTDPSPSVVSYLICNCVFLLELVGLVILARIFHKRSMPEDVIHSPIQDKKPLPIEHTLNNNERPEKEGIDNVMFA